MERHRRHFEHHSDQYQSNTYPECGTHIRYNSQPFGYFVKLSHSKSAVNHAHAIEQYC